MGYCNKCKVHITGKRQKCPLCGGLLKIEEETEEKFPVIHSVYYRHLFLFKLLLLLSAVIGAVAVVLNCIFFTESFWSIFVLAGIGCGWISLLLLLSKRNNIHKNLLWQLILIVVLSVLWDKGTGWHGWAVTYVIPIACCVMMLIMTLLSKVLKLHRGDYIIYLLFDCLFGILPVVFIAADMVQVIFPSVICAAASVVSFIAIVLFEGKSMVEELKCRLHL